MVHYSDELIDEIRNSNDIVDVISQYVTLKRSGRNFFGLCPFHKEKSPSFSVSPDKQIFHCFGCGVGGNVIHFISKIENLNFVETLHVLAERAGIVLPTIETGEDSKRQELKNKVYQINEITAQFYHENLYKPVAKSAQEYVKKRKLTNTTLKNFKIGYAGIYNELSAFLKQKGFSDTEILESSLASKLENGKLVDRYRGRLMFPICDVRGKVIAFGGRVLDDSKPKYINSPENIVYSKGRHLYGLNVAKQNNPKELIIVEGYMDAISLHQRDIPNVVASLGTALTEAQGRLLRKYCEKVIIGYDSDGAGQTATLRGLEILNNLGCDIRVLQLEGAKDPDEFVIKYGSGRFNKAVEEAISLVEFKIKTLKKDLNLENVNDKIKFLNEIAKILSKVDNQMEKEIYIDKIANEYKISKEAIYAEINKQSYAQKQSIKILDKPIRIRTANKIEETEEISKEIIQRENAIILLIINGKAIQEIMENIPVEEFKYDLNRKIAEKLYDEYKKGNSNTRSILDLFEDEKIINHLSGIMAMDMEIIDVNKTINEIIDLYRREKLTQEKNEIIKKLENKELDKQKQEELENRLSNIIIELAKKNRG